MSAATLKLQSPCSGLLGAIPRRHGFSIYSRNLAQCKRQYTAQTPIQSQKQQVPAQGPESKLVHTPIQSFDSNRLAQQEDLRLKHIRGDRPLYYLTIAAVIGTPIIVYLYYEHRKQHMHNKRQQLLRDAQEKWKAKGGG